MSRLLKRVFDNFWSSKISFVLSILQLVSSVFASMLSVATQLLTVDNASSTSNKSLFRSFFTFKLPFWFKFAPSVLYPLTNLHRNQNAKTDTLRAANSGAPMPEKRVARRTLSLLASRLLLATIARSLSYLSYKPF